jgi:GNAT superfamily N-acetyltransferase
VGRCTWASCTGRAVGTLALQWSDEETWGNVSEDAGYVHGLAIRRDSAGRGVGRELLRWAEGSAAVAENRALHEYYGGAGFGYRGRVLVRGLEVSLYVKKVGVGNAG